MEGRRAPVSSMEQKLSLLSTQPGMRQGGSHERAHPVAAPLGHRSNLASRPPSSRRDSHSQAARLLRQRRPWRARTPTHTKQPCLAPGAHLQGHGAQLSPHVNSLFVLRRALRLRGRQPAKPLHQSIGAGGHQRYIPTCNKCMSHVLDVGTR